MARLPRSHPGIPYELDRYLTPAEKIVFRTRLHWIRIVRPSREAVSPSDNRCIASE